MADLFDFDGLNLLKAELTQIVSDRDTTEEELDKLTEVIEKELIPRARH